jgi:hypothetical protein
MDDADRATPHIENTLADALAEIRSKPSLIPCGSCYNCGDPIPQHHLYCSGECSVDHRHREERRKVNGQ